MKFKLQSTYSQLTFMFGGLILFNFIIIIVALRQLTIYPAATQIGELLNNQINSIKSVIKDKNLPQAQEFIDNAKLSNQFVLSAQPQAKAFPSYKFYKVLSNQLNKGNNRRLLLQESDEGSKIWIKSTWQKGYWLGISFQPFVTKVSNLLLFLIITLLILSLIAAYFFSRYMLKPLKNLAQMAVAIVEEKDENKNLKIKGSKEVREITRLVKRSAQQIAQLNKEKELLLAGVSHDLRTPLARMRLQAEFLGDDESREVFISDIEEMDNIIGDFVTYVRSGTIEEFQKLDIVNIVGETIEQFCQHGKCMEFNKPDKAIMFAIKPLSLKRMLSNIFDNAFKYGKAPVEVSITQDNNRLMICVLDHGKGLDADELTQVFEPFVMAQTADNQFGSGLGLSIVAKLAQQNNAHVYAENHTDGGLNVCIEFNSVST
jgi:two-component system osmolarity sensor histidine kinase EnvZ